VPELRAAEKRVVCVDQALVAAPVDRERGTPASGLGCGEVCVDVGAAEGVDRLLGIADQDERDAPITERAPHDVPLDRVCVLELVDQDDAVASPQPRGRGGPARPRERLVEARQQIVVGHDRQAALAELELVANGDRQPAAHLGDGAGGGHDRRGRVLDRRVRDLRRLRAPERGRAAVVEAAHVEVVDHLLDDVAGVLDESGVALEVPRDPEPAEHLLAEAVGGRDSGGVEVRQRARDPFAPGPDLGVGPIGEQRHHLVARVGRRARERAREPPLDADEPLAHALAQLSRRHARERHEQ